VIAGATGFLLSRVVKAHHRQVLTGEEGMVGEVGKSLTEIAPMGKVLVHGEDWDARSTGAAIPEGTAVRVLAVGQRRIDVEPAEGAGEGPVETAGGRST